MNWFNSGDWICDSSRTKSMLVVAPHADDETLGMGGTIARARASGIDVKVVLLTRRTNGVAGFHRSSRIIGFKPIELPRIRGFPVLYKDGTLSYNRSSLVQQLNTLIRLEKPEIVLAPYHHEKHSDHQVASWSTEYATWRASRIQPNVEEPHRVKWLLYYEILGPHEGPTLLVKLTPDSFRLKWKAMIEAYENEVKRSPDYLLYSYFGSILRGLQLESPTNIKDAVGANIKSIAKIAEHLPMAEAFFM